MDLSVNINYYYMNKILSKLRESDYLSEAEYDSVKKRLVEICQPDPEYIR